MPQDSGELFPFLLPVKQCCVSEKFKDHTKSGFLPLQIPEPDRISEDTGTHRQRSILLLWHGRTSPAGVTGSAGRVRIFQMHETDRSLSSGKHSLYWQMGVPRLQPPAVSRSAPRPGIYWRVDHQPCHDRALLSGV